MNALVFVKYNLQLRARDKLRGERGDQDPICLSDIESDDEWITEKEDPALPTDHSWLEVDEIFEEEEYVPRKRQQRNKLPVRRNHGNRNSQNTTKEKVDSVEEIVDEDGLEEGSDSGMVELMDVSEDDEGRAGDDEYDDGFLF